MEYPAKQAKDFYKELPGVNYPQIRLFIAQRAIKDQPANDVVGSWAPCTPQSVADFTAVGYFTGRELFQKLNVPIGLVKAAYSGSIIQAWMSPDMLQSDPDFKPFMDRWQKTLAAYPQAKAEWWPRDWV